MEKNAVRTFQCIHKYVEPTTELSQYTKPYAGFFFLITQFRRKKTTGIQVPTDYKRHLIFLKREAKKKELDEWPRENWTMFEGKMILVVFGRRNKLNT